jgi:hypothetical protein
MRLALYLDSIDKTPTVSGETYPERIKNLTSQFENLQIEQRKEGRRIGRIRIRESGGLDAAAAYLVPIPAKAQRRQIRIQKRREITSRWPLDSPACYRCTVRGFNIPKRSWPSQDAADAVRLSLRDPLLTTYECPEKAGSFHIGHRKRRPNELR